MRQTAVLWLVVGLLLAVGMAGCNGEPALQTVVVPRDTEAPPAEAQEDSGPSTPTVTLRPTDMTLQDPTWGNSLAES